MKKYGVVLHTTTTAHPEAELSPIREINILRRNFNYYGWPFYQPKAKINGWRRSGTSRLEKKRGMG